MHVENPCWLVLIMIYVADNFSCMAQCNLTMQK